MAMPPHLRSDKKCYLNQEALNRQSHLVLAELTLCQESPGIYNWVSFAYWTTSMTNALFLLTGGLTGSGPNSVLLPEPSANFPRKKVETGWLLAERVGFGDGHIQSIRKMTLTEKATSNTKVMRRKALLKSKTNRKYAQVVQTENLPSSYGYNKGKRHNTIKTCKILSS